MHKEYDLNYISDEYINKSGYHLMSFQNEIFESFSYFRRIISST